MYDLFPPCIYPAPLKNHLFPDISFGFIIDKFFLGQNKVNYVLKWSLIEIAQGFLEPGLVCSNIKT